MGGTVGLLTVLLSVSLTSCWWKHSVVEYVSGRTPVAEVGTDVLYLEDLKQAIPLGLSDADSTKLAQQYIRNWVEDVLFYQNAIRNIPDTKDIDRLVENYRRSLIEHEYQRSRMAEDEHHPETPEDALDMPGAVEAEIPPVEEDDDQIVEEIAEGEMMFL